MSPTSAVFLPSKAHLGGLTFLTSKPDLEGEALAPPGKEGADSRPPSPTLRPMLLLLLSLNIELVVLTAQFPSCRENSEGAT